MILDDLESGDGDFNGLFSRVGYIEIGGSLAPV